MSKAIELWEKALKLIRLWHGMGMPENGEKLAWKIYSEKSPEIQEIKTYIAELAKLPDLEKENKILRLKARAVDRLPFCPDHRDKVAGKPCRECEIEQLNGQIKAMRRRNCGFQT